MTYEIDEYPPHNCGRAVGYCQHEDTKIFFCLLCKKVTGAAKESQMKITISVEDFDGEMNEYSKEFKEANV